MLILDRVLYCYTRIRHLLLGSFVHCAMRHLAKASWLYQLLQEGREHTKQGTQKIGANYYKSTLSTSHVQFCLEVIDSFHLGFPSHTA